MPREVDREWHQIDDDPSFRCKWCWCDDPIVMEATEACDLCAADNAELQLEGYDQVLVSKFCNGEMHLIEWRWSRGER